jgi:hypothetical protein
MPHALQQKSVQISWCKYGPAIVSECSKHASGSHRRRMRTLDGLGAEGEKNARGQTVNVSVDLTSSAPGLTSFAKGSTLTINIVLNPQAGPQDAEAIDAHEGVRGRHSWLRGTSFSATLCRSRAPVAGMSKRQNSHSVRAAALCCSHRARNVITPLNPLGRIARIADSNCPSRRRELHKIPLWRRDGVRLRAVCGPRLTGFRDCLQKPSAQVVRYASLSAIIGSTLVARRAGR